MQSGATKSVPRNSNLINANREPIESLVRKFRTGEYLVAVYGLGHVGAPLASVWLRTGIRVIGIDKSKKVIENTRNGITHIPEPLVNESFSQGLNEARFLVYEDPVK
ncbi:MAG TPA: hypothetical protein VFT71_08080, partial [Candidatus Nitrosocosmicus sp.]|nr:hypothetical protein [Candidatus Nitrosocosmicus sp.]